LLKYGASPDGKGEKRKIPKENEEMWHIEIDFADNIQEEIEDTQQEDEALDTRSLLCWAVRNGELKIAQRLITAGVSCQQPALLSMAVQGTNLELVDFFARMFTKSEVESAGEIPLHWAALNGWIEAAQILLQAGVATVSERCGDGMTPLHFAVLGGRVEMVKKLMEWGASVEEFTEDGTTCLELAEEQGHVEVVNLLREIMHI
jgi:ankyrin repeat protein